MYFHIRFVAVKRGAIGVHSTFQEVVEAEDERAAILKLYDRYDHIHQPVVAACKFSPKQSVRIKRDPIDSWVVLRVIIDPRFRVPNYRVVNVHAHERVVSELDLEEVK